jgi:chromodomain-helicase-DNA-binding protein 1
MERNESFEIVNDVPSESDLSDVQAPDMEASSPSASPMRPTVHRAAILPRIELGSNSPPESSEHDASEDADYDIVDTPRSGPTGAAGMERTSSNESRPPARRKNGHPLEDDFIRDNPELYGLRRSVRLAFIMRRRTMLTYPVIVPSRAAASSGRWLTRSDLTGLV